MKTIKVVAAVICDSLENKQQVYATERGYGEFEGGWEFPGGKVEPGESNDIALIREIKEELDVDIIVADLITTVEYDYPTFHLSMDCYWAEVKSGNLTLIEANAAKWFTKGQLDSVDWLPADIELVDIVRRNLK